MNSKTEQQRNFLGIPIEGTLNGTGSRYTVQRPITEFQIIMQCVLDFPEVHDLGWRQFTPYFNDGDPCVFSADSFWLRTTADVDPARDLDEDISEEKFAMYDHPSLGKRLHRYDHNVEAGTAKEGDYIGSNAPLYDAARALDKAVEGGEFDAVLMQLFGDHAEVRVTRERIIVDTVEHD